MKTRIAIPVENQDGLEAPIAEHFGRAPFFAIVDLDEKGKVASVKTEANTGEHHGGTGHPHENLLAFKTKHHCSIWNGPGGLTSFQNAGVNVLKATAKTVQEAVTQFKAGTLEKLTGGCEHAHHHTH